MKSYILQHVDEIRKHQQSPINWWVNRTEMVYKQVLQVIEPNEEKRNTLVLSRQIIVELYKQDLYRGFMATMLWGGKNKIGLETIINQKRDGEEGVEKKLFRVKNLIQQGKICEAYISMSKDGVSDKKKSNYIEQVGPAFFTKVFYFMNKAFPSNNRLTPLIHDKHMSYVHCALLLDEYPNKQPYYKWYTPMHSPEGIGLIHKDSVFGAKVYMNYIECMHKIASDNNIEVSSDTLEAYLFDLIRNQAIRILLFI